MRVGTIIGGPSGYTRFAMIRDQRGDTHTIDTGELPDGAEVGDEFAYKVELYSNNGGLAYNLKED